MKSFFGPSTDVSDPKNSPSDDDREELLTLYKLALDEYRFQVNLNWSRTQYYIALNVAILGIATGLFRIQANKTLTASIGLGLYATGIVCCVLSLAANQVQRNYYRQAKRHKAMIEERLGLGDLAIRTTPGMGSQVKRVGKVTTFNTAILTILLGLDVTGLTLSIVQLA